MKTKTHQIKKVKTIRFIYTIGIFLLFLLFGCDRGTELISPINESINLQQKITSNFPLSADGITSDAYLDRKEEYPPGSDTIFVSFKLPASELLVASKI